MNSKKKRFYLFAGFIAIEALTLCLGISIGKGAMPKTKNLSASMINAAPAFSHEVASKEPTEEELIAALPWDERIAAQAEKAEIEIRTKQFNMFSIPADHGNVIWNYYYNTQKPFHILSVDYSTLPRPISEETFEEVENFAKRYIGTPYLHEENGKMVGFDCSGFVYFVLNHVTKSISSSACEGQYMQCKEVDEAHLSPGDLVFFKGTQNRESISHVGLYLGDGEMIHASSNHGVEICKVHEGYWGKHFYSYGRPLVDRISEETAEN